MSFFTHHVFFCTNQRAAGEMCCENHSAGTLLAYAKDKIAAAGKKDSIRINKAGCLGRCDVGPVLVVYPEAIWYTYVDQEDIDEIIESHLLGGQPVERLKV